MVQTDCGPHALSRTHRAVLVGGGRQTRSPKQERGPGNPPAQSHNMLAVVSGPLRLHTHHVPAVAASRHSQGASAVRASGTAAGACQPCTRSSSGRHPSAGFTKLVHNRYTVNFVVHIGMPDTISAIVCRNGGCSHRSRGTLAVCCVLVMRCVTEPQSAAAGAAVQVAPNRSASAHTGCCWGSFTSRGIMRLNIRQQPASTCPPDDPSQYRHPCGV